MTVVNPVGGSVMCCPSRASASSRLCVLSEREKSAGDHTGQRSDSEASVLSSCPVALRCLVGEVARFVLARDPGQGLFRGEGRGKQSALAQSKSDAADLGQVRTAFDADGTRNESIVASDREHRDELSAQVFELALRSLFRQMQLDLGEVYIAR